jgi:hypothetical protein
MSTGVVWAAAPVTTIADRVAAPINIPTLLTATSPILSQWAATSVAERRSLSAVKDNLAADEAGGCDEGHASKGRADPVVTELRPSPDGTGVGRGTGHASLRLSSAAISASVIGLNCLASSKFSSSCPISVMPMMAVATGKLRV